MTMQQQQQLALNQQTQPNLAPVSNPMMAPQQATPRQQLTKHIKNKNSQQQQQQQQAVNVVRGPVPNQGNVINANPRMQVAHNMYRFSLTSLSVANITRCGLFDSLYSMNVQVFC